MNNNNYSSRGGLSNSRGGFRGDNRENHYQYQNRTNPIKPLNEKSNRMSTPYVSIAEKENRSDNIGLSNHAE